MGDYVPAGMGASNIDQKLSGVLLVEHLAALGVVLMAVGWLALLMRTYQQVVIPVRQETTAYYAARVALMRVPARGGETQVSVGPDVWKVDNRLFQQADAGSGS